MFYTYKSFAFICVSLASVTQEAISQANAPFKLFEDIIYQSLGKTPSFSDYKNSKELSKIYHAWSLIKQLIERNKSFPKSDYKSIIETILHTDAEYDIASSFHTGVLSELKTLLNTNKVLFQPFFDMGTDRYLDELMDGFDLKDLSINPVV